MLVTRFEQSASFMGRLDQAQDVAAGFKTICRENSIRCGWISASAMIRNPVVCKAGAAGFGQPAQLDGSFFFPSISGNISLAGDDVMIRLLGESHSTDGSRIAGTIEGGEVVFCEFLITVCEDSTLVRDRGTPFSPWVQLQATAVSTVEEFQNHPARPLMMSTPASPDDDETTELNILEMKRGDYVDHPRFGICRISTEPVGDKISIRLSTGKQVDLSLGIMRVREPELIGDKRVFRLEIKRRV